MTDDTERQLSFFELPAPPGQSQPGRAAGNLHADGDEERATETDAVIDSPEEETDDEAAGESAAPQPPDWKDELRRDFETWLDTVNTMPGAEEASADDIDEAPDLYSFFAQLTAASTESRKANRRTAEAMSQWGETLARFESGLQPLRETAAQLAAAQPRDGRISREHCLVLVELLDRMNRLARAFESPPAAKGFRRFWGGEGAWRRTWDAQHRALDILVGHLEGLLRTEGVTPIDTMGQSFDPALMMAVAADQDAGLPPNTVLEEVVTGYCRDDKLLRAAHVKVAARRAGERDSSPST